MLTLRIELLTGRYVASAYNDRSRPEWPPHPARVFSALVDTHYDGHATANERDALEWLESQPAPTLAFSNESRRSVKTHYVPVNDKALSDRAVLVTAWAKVLSHDLSDSARAKAEARLAATYAKVSSEEAVLPKKFREDLAHVLPQSRTRQARLFPSVTPEDPFVELTWSAEPAVEIRTALDCLARRLVRVGHSSSLVAARWVDECATPRWIPDDTGSHQVRWVGPGQLSALDELYAAAPFSEQRVMPYVVARYRSKPLRAQPRTTKFSPTFVVLRRVSGPRIPIVAGEAVADAVRGALMSHASAPTPPLLSGHGLDGGPMLADHVAIVPLPFVGGRRATGDLLGVAIIPPADISRESIVPVYAAIANWEAASASSSAGAPRSSLTMGRLGRWVLEREIDPSPLHNLRDSTWTRPSTQWTSATPIVLDRHPGDLDARQPSRRRRAHARVLAAVESACVRIGLPAPIEIEYGEAAYLFGSEPANRFRRRASADDRRPLVHVRLTFAEPVSGPVLLGAGRYRGLGLFRPTNGERS